MDLGDAGHILLTARSAEGLRQFNDYKKIIHEIGDYPIKHGQSIRVYSAYGKDFGNGTVPKVKPLSMRGKIIPAKRKGPTAHLRSLSEEGFFREPKSIGNILNELSTRSYHYKQSDLTMPLQLLVRDRILRRTSLIGDEGRNVLHWVNW